VTNKKKINDLSVLGFIKVRSEIHVPEELKSVSNPAYSILPDKKSVQMTMGLQDLLGESSNTGIRLRF
jgi:hypothetical protein